jgi:hypothetical protein
VKRLPGFATLRSAKAYEDFLKASYAGVKQRPEEVWIPPVQVISVTGNEPPASRQFQDAVAVLYGIGYSLRMGLKFGKLRKPAGYFDYKVGALETRWWSTGKVLEISNPKTLRWRACLMVPAFVNQQLFDQARALAHARHPDLPYHGASLTTLDVGHSVQMLHVGPYDREQPTVDRIHAYAAAHELAVTGNHQEIYISDPRRTAPAKLKTVIRLGVAPA